MDDNYQIEPPIEIEIIVPLELFEADLKPIALLILFIVFSWTEPTINKHEIQSRGGLTESTWLKYSKELVEKGWLIRKNRGSKGRGKWLWEHTFLRKPRKNPLSGGY